MQHPISQSRRRVLCILTAALLSLGLGSFSGAAEYSTVYATIRYDADEDLYSFTRSIAPGLGFLSGNPRKDPRLTARRVDELVLKVMDILDLRLPELHFSIRLHHKQEDINRTFAYLFRNGRAPAAYYDHTTRTIGVSLDAVSDGMLAHEIAHAVICSWFPVPPPAQLQEVLATYVERQLEKE